MRSRHSFSDNEDVAFSLRAMRKLWPYLMRFKGRIALALTCLIAAKLASVYMPFVLKHVVDALAGSTSQPDLAYFPLGLLLAYGLVRLANTLFGEVRDVLFGRVTEQAMHQIGLDVFKHLHNLDLGFHLSRSTGALSRDIERGTSGISFVMRFMVFNILPTLFEIAMVTGVLLLHYQTSFALITLAAVVAYISFSVMATHWRTQYLRAANKADSESNARAVDSLLNYETVKYFTNEEYETRHYDLDLQRWETARRQNRLSLFVLNGGQALIVAIAMTSMLLLAANYVRQGAMTIGDFVLINAFMMQLFLPLNLLGFVYREMRGAMVNIERMFDLLDQRPAIMDKPMAKPLAVQAGTVEFRNVEFAYTAERSILQNISFTLQAGKKLAVVGSSGSGKSTLVRLLFRFYDVNAGAILIDGQDIREVTQHSLRGAIGIVPQDTVLFNASIKDNIRYGNTEASDAEIMEAVRLAHLQHFIQQLPLGLDTLVGERGLKLSGGEKQRIAIARAILKRPSILVFDEATSSLDSHSEQSIMQALREISVGITSLAIAHRLSTIADADLIVVMENGHLVEQGTHNELLSRKGRYAGLWQAQQENNRESAPQVETIH
ncbi:metal ABC transporter permease [Pokkaliibacter plantistimulans]|uniref:Metal ABC transporter permease n=2 Tax=Pokkaliibacter plantistimulans TaxID=1635171 RepID=A0ABX5M1B3_9GAMM|nr:metal ABC transporter permease [Pokkaliibacter plantistimulans]